VCFFFGKNTPEEKLCRGIGSSSVKFFLCIPTKQKLAALFFLQTLVALDTDEHRVLLRNMYGNKSWLSNKKKKRFVQTLKFWSLKKLLQSKDSRCCFCEQPIGATSLVLRESRLFSSDLTSSLRKTWKPSSPSTDLLMLRKFSPTVDASTVRLYPVNKKMYEQLGFFTYFEEFTEI
jgi:hypothetical protein